MDRDHDRPQMLHLMIHADDRLMHFLGKLLQKSSGLTQQEIDALTRKMKEGNDSLDAWLKQTPPAQPAP